MASSSHQQSSWLTDFHTSLVARDRVEHAHDDIIAAYQRLAARAPRPTNEAARLERRCKDLEEEIRAKDKAVQATQDEMVALNLELNMVEKRNGELRRDNQELLDRWMKLKREEAEEMNKRGGF